VIHSVRRLGWGVVDQGVSSLTNFAVTIEVARTLGAAQFGAFSLAYVTYSFALNASRGLATDPLMVRFSNSELPVWRRAVASCTGTSVVVGMVAGLLALVAAAVLHGTTRSTFLALGLTMPALMLQDSWRYAFFALGRGGHSFLNDLVWGLALVPALVLLKVTGRETAFWFVFAWGAAAGVAAVVGLFQARVIPRLSGTRDWLSKHRDLGWRYLAEGTCSSATLQLRTYGVSLILGLAAVGYVQAASTLMGPFTVLFFGLSLVMIPEAARILDRSPRRLPLFCVLVTAALAGAALLWGVFLLVALPRGLGTWLLGPIWRPTYPLVLPYTICLLEGSISIGAGAGLRALGAARQSLRAMVIGSVLVVIFSLAGAQLGGASGTVQGAAVGGAFGSLMWWWQLRTAFRKSEVMSASRRTAGSHRKPMTYSRRAQRVSSRNGTGGWETYPVHVSGEQRQRSPSGEAQPW
jgi:O-antigen/teichoic acid export membrane protein